MSVSTNTKFTPKQTNGQKETTQAKARMRTERNPLRFNFDPKLAVSQRHTLSANSAYNQFTLSALNQNEFNQQADKVICPPLVVSPVRRILDSEAWCTISYIYLYIHTPQFLSNSNHKLSVAVTIHIVVMSVSIQHRPGMRSRQPIATQHVQTIREVT